MTGNRINALLWGRSGYKDVLRMCENVACYDKYDMDFSKLVDIDVLSFKDQHDIYQYIAVWCYDAPGMPRAKLYGRSFDSHNEAMGFAAHIRMEWIYRRRDNGMA